MVRFVKFDIMSGVRNASKRMAVDFSKTDNVQPLHSIDVRFATLTACMNASGLDVMNFGKECFTYLQQLCTKLVAKCPLKCRLVKGATC